MFRTLLLWAGLKQQYPQLTEEDVRRHNTRSSLWIVAGDSVYDVTPILGNHPGGEAALLRRGGGVKGCAEDLDLHSRNARRVWQELKVGEISAAEREKLFLHEVDAARTGGSLPHYPTTPTTSVTMYPSSTRFPSAAFLSQSC